MTETTDEKAQSTRNAGFPQSAKLALASLSLCMLLSSLATSIANVSLPTLAHAFNASFQDIQWVVLAYLLTITTLIVSVGRLGDLVGRRRLLLSGIAIFTSASILCGISPTLGLLISARAAQGLGAAIMMALTMAFVGQTVPKAKTGSAMGLLGTMSAVGTALGPSLGGVLIAGVGWNSIFLVNAPLGGVAFALTYRYLPIDQKHQSSERAGFDVLGTILLAITLGAYAMAMTSGHGSFGKFNIFLLVVSALGVASFLFVETRVASPLVRLSMFRQIELSSGLLLSIIVSTVLMSILVVGPFYLSRGLGLGSVQVGVVMSIGPIVVALTGVPAGRFAELLGPSRMTIIGLTGIFMGALGLSLIPEDWGVPGYLVPVMVATCGYGLFQTANNTGVMANIHAERRGVVSGLLNLSRNLGLITGASVMGAVFAAASMSNNITTANADAVAAGMRATFGTAAVLIAIALAVAAGSRFAVKGKEISSSL